MAKGQGQPIEISLETTNLEPIRAELERVFAKPDLAKVLEAAIKKAIEPVYQRLRTITPLGPTGNLRRAVDKKFKAYPTTGNAVGLVGYRAAGTDRSESAGGGTVRAGKDRAFHQWWIERGVKERTITKISNTPYTRRGHTRRTKSGTVADVQPHSVSGQNAVIASSFRKLGPFRFLATPRPPRGETGQRVQTDPAYPRAFFKKSKDAITIRAQPPGGRDGRPPLSTAWAETGTVAAEIMQRELQAALATALDGLTRLGDRSAA